MGSPLEGIKVVECAIWVQGPSAGFMLGDLGADVIKIESLEGDPVRGNMKTGNFDMSGRNFTFEYANRNKRSLCLDLKKEEGRKIVHKLIERADIFLHNMRLDTPERLGLDYKTLSALNPGIIYAQSSGWGPEGADRNRPAFEVTAMARAGWNYFAGGPDTPPLWFVSGLGDQLGGTYTTLAILAALFVRERTGVGQMVDVSLLGSLTAAAGIPMSTQLINNEAFPRRDRASVPNALYNLYECADGKYIYLAMMPSDKYWNEFCSVMNCEYLSNDLRFQNNEKRRENRKELISILDKVFAAKTRAEWVGLFESTGFVFGSVQTVAEAITDPQVLANDYVMDFDHPAYGPTKIVGFPYKFSETPASVRRESPELGQHTEEVLLEIGYSMDDMAKLRNEGII